MITQAETISISSSVIIIINLVTLRQVTLGVMKENGVKLFSANRLEKTR